MQYGELNYRLVIAVDIEDFTRLDTLDQSLAQSKLSQALEQAARGAGLDRASWYRQLRGDGELAVLPACTDVAWVVAMFTEQLATTLASMRRAGTPKSALRLRLAMHHGTLTAGDFGPVGSALTVACRLLDAEAVRRALCEESDSDLVLVISDQLYRDVVETRFHGLSPARFRWVCTPAKRDSYIGYVCTGTPRTPVDLALGSTMTEAFVRSDGPKVVASQTRQACDTRSSYLATGSYDPGHAIRR